MTFREKAEDFIRYSLKYRKTTIVKVAAGVLIFAVALILFIAGEAEKKDEPVLISAGEVSEAETEDESTEDENADFTDPLASEVMIYVDVEGAVGEPGVVCIPEGSRVFYAISKAGALLEDADTRNVNLAAVVYDGDKIYIPTAEEVNEDKSAGGFVENAGNTSGTSHPDMKSEGSSGNGLININTAGSEELQKLTGVGPSTAQKIIDYRESAGGFSDVTDLLNVSGIGEKTLSKFVDKICI